MLTAAQLAKKLLTFRKKVHYHVHNSQPESLILNQMNLFYTSPHPCYFNMHFKMNIL